MSSLAQAARLPRFHDPRRGGAASPAPALPAVRTGLVEDFYRVILEHPEARAVFADAAQIDRLKRSLADWLTRLLEGPFDDEWIGRGARIGRRHVEVGLPLRFMPLAMNRLRRGLVEMALAANRERAAEASAAVAAVEKAIDLELTIMLESYAETHQSRVRQSERLAAAGQLAGRLGEELKNPPSISTSPSRSRRPPGADAIAKMLRLCVRRAAQSSRPTPQSASHA
jgi:truncated hemoglobin YjbI